MSNFIDRRLNNKNKSTVNRQRFIRRYKSQIKKAVNEAIHNRGVTDVDSGESITIPSKDLNEPTFQQGSGGIRDRVHPGNDQFTTGDRIKRPPQQQGQGSGEGDATNTGEGEDEFVFNISKDEYLNLLFEDLELPNLEKNQLDKVIEYKTSRAGFCADGIPSNIDVVRSLKNSIGRRLAMTGDKRKQLRKLEAELNDLEQDPHDNTYQINALLEQITLLKEKIAKVPFIDTFDLRFRNFEKQAVPTSKAVMFCLMDVSGSMDQATKDMAKRFYILLYLFLTRTYKTIDVIYIRHHTQAKEVDEQEFFYSQETGGTIASSALELMIDIMKKRYPANEWNIYAAQASDGDNWADDSPNCRKLLEHDILPNIRYFSYIEITQRTHQTLWHEYQKVVEANPRMAIQHIKTKEDIYPVFRKLFAKSVSEKAA